MNPGHSVGVEGGSRCRKPFYDVLMATVIVLSFLLLSD